jgi:hypothetical protein
VASSAIQGEKKRLGTQVDYRSIAIVEAFPDALNVLTGEDEEFCRMRRAKVVRIGTTNDVTLEGGGLLIDYVPRCETIVRRAVFSFNERGLWMEAEVLLSKEASVS